MHRIRPVTPADAAQICEIYNYYVLNTHINFEEEEVPVHDMQQRIINITRKHPWFVCEEDGKLVGYAYASEWKVRSAYRFSAECTIYLAHGTIGKGIGTLLYEALLNKISESDIHVIIGGIAQPNEASIALHEKFGFEKVAHFKEVGFKFNKWIDVAYWEKIIPR